MVGSACKSNPNPNSDLFQTVQRVDDDITVSVLGVRGIDANTQRRVDLLIERRFRRGCRRSSSRGGGAKRMEIAYCDLGRESPPRGKETGRGADQGEEEQASESRPHGWRGTGAGADSSRSAERFVDAERGM